MREYPHVLQDLRTRGKSKTNELASRGWPADKGILHSGPQTANQSVATTRESSLWWRLQIGQPRRSRLRSSMRCVWKESRFFCPHGPWGALQASQGPPAFLMTSDDICTALCSIILTWMIYAAETFNAHAIKQSVRIHVRVIHAWKSLIYTSRVTSLIIFL